MLDEAIANWKQEERRALVDAAAAKTVADMDRIVLRLDAAVRDCMLAAHWYHDGALFVKAHDCSFNAEINRLLPEGSEGGKDERS